MDISNVIKSGELYTGTYSSPFQYPVTNDPAKAKATVTVVNEMLPSGESVVHVLTHGAELLLVRNTLIAALELVNIKLGKV